MRLADLSYELPAELIAQQPAAERGASQLMHVRRGEGPIRIARFDEFFPTLLADDDLLVVNDTRVLKARLACRRPSGGRVELLLLNPVPDAGPHAWEAMVRPARKLEEGMPLELEEATGTNVTAIERTTGATWTVELPVEESEVADWLDTVGDTPLPPYISEQPADPSRYQTVFAQHPGSVAAPTASLHLDGRMWDRLAASHEVARVTLHVGPGTFLPIRTDVLDEHDMHAERYLVAPAADAAIRSALDAGRRIVAIGTTVCRVLETVYGAAPGAGELSGSTRLFVRPGHEFAAVGALLTNFHLPGSTLLALVMAFAGIDPTRAAYDRAITERMRFFSFGDAMFIT